MPPFISPSHISRAIAGDHDHQRVFDPVVSVHQRQYLKPSITGILISKRISEIPVPYCFNRSIHSSPFAASKILYSSSRITARISRFIWNHLRSGPAAFPAFHTVNTGLFCYRHIFPVLCLIHQAVRSSYRHFPLFHYQLKTSNAYRQGEAVYIRELLPHRPYPGSVLTSLKKHLPTHPEGSAKFIAPIPDQDICFRIHLRTIPTTVFNTISPAHYVTRYHCTV